MKLAGKPELQQRLAAEYALGTLRGRARARLARALRGDAALSRAVAEWETRLAPLADAVPPVQPPARVWRAIEARLPAADSAGWWENLPFWRGLGLAMSGAAAALLVAVATLSPQPPAPAPAPVALKAPWNEVAEVYLAVLADPKTQKPLLIASASYRSDRLQVRTLDPAIRVADKDLELWALPTGKAPLSLGVLGAGERATVQLASAAERSLADVPALAVSLEPKGGSPKGAPTGPVLAVGPCVKFW